MLSIGEEYAPSYMLYFPPDFTKFVSNPLYLNAAAIYVVDKELPELQCIFIALIRTVTVDYQDNAIAAYR